LDEVGKRTGEGVMDEDRARSCLFDVVLFVAAAGGFPFSLELHEPSSVGVEKDGVFAEVEACASTLASGLSVKGELAWNVIDSVGDARELREGPLEGRVTVPVPRVREHAHHRVLVSDGVMAEGAEELGVHRFRLGFLGIVKDKSATMSFAVLKVMRHERVFSCGSSSS